MLYFEESKLILKCMKAEESFKNKLQVSKANLNLHLRALESKIEQAVYKAPDNQKMKAQRLLKMFQKKFVNGRKRNQKQCDLLFYHRLVQFLTKMEDFQSDMVADQLIQEMQQQQQQQQQQIPIVDLARDNIAAIPDSTTLWMK